MKMHCSIVHEFPRKILRVCTGERIYRMDPIIQKCSDKDKNIQ